MEHQNDFAVELLKAELDVIELDDRLEMINLSASLALEEIGDIGDNNNGVCCCS